MTSSGVHDERPDPVNEHGAAVDALRETWSRHVSDWRADPALNLGVSTLGEECGGPALADLVVDAVAAPQLGPSVDVLELGCGGGKFSTRLASRARSLLCTDISAEMIAHTRATLAQRGLDDKVAGAGAAPITSPRSARNASG